MKKLLLAALFSLFSTAAFAQCNGAFGAGQVCGTAAGGPPGPVSPAVLPVPSSIPVVNPSSGNLFGAGCAVPNQIFVTNENACINADRLNFTSTDPSADVVITLGGTLTVGDVLHISLQFPNLSLQTLNITIPSSPTPAGVINLIIAAVKANSSLFTSPNGGYASGAPIGYIVNVGSTAFAFDYNSHTGISSFLYTCTGTCGETLTVSSGWIGLQLYVGGTTSGSANAQACTATGWGGSIYSSVQCTIGVGLTNTGATTLNVNTIGAFTVLKYASNGSLVNLTGGELQAGSTYVLNWDPTSSWVLGYSAGRAFNGSTPNTTYFLPTSLDNNPLWFPARQSSNGTPPNITSAAAPGSALWNIQVGCADTNAVAQGGAVDINCATFALFVKNLVAGPAPPETAWFLNSAAGSGWWIGHGIYANAGSCSFNFQPGCGYQDEGNGTINAVSYYLGNSLIAGQNGSLTNGFFSGVMNIGGLATIANAVLQVHTGTDQNLLVTPHANLSSGLTFNMINDAANANVPLEILSSNVQFSLGTVNFGIAGTIVGNAIFNNATSGSITVHAPTGALGTVNNILQAVNDTFVYKTTNDTLINKIIQTSSVDSSPVGANSASTGAFTALVWNNTFGLGSHILASSTAPTISSGFGTSPSVTANNGTMAFDINVGTGGTASSGVVGLPAANTGWNCYATDITTQSTSVFHTKQTASSTTSCTVTNYNTAGAATAWAASDHLRVSAFAF